MRLLTKNPVTEAKRATTLNQARGSEALVESFPCWGLGYSGVPKALGASRRGLDTNQVAVEAP
jgi:hypothetical protein